MKKLNYRKTILLIADIFLIVGGSIASFYFINYFDPRLFISTNLVKFIFIYTSFCILTMFLSGSYSKMWRYSKAQDYFGCAAGMSIGSLITLGINAFTQHIVANTYFVFNFALCTSGVLLIRLIFAKGLVVVYKETSDDIERGATLIIGAGYTGRQIVKEMRHAPSKYKPVAFVDDDITKMYQTLDRLKIVGSTNDIVDVCQEFDIVHIVFAIPSCDSRNRKRILDLCYETSCDIKIVPHLHELLFNESFLYQVKDINIEDLLGREKISFDNVDINNFIKDRVCMVTGGGGSIGSEICRQITKYSPTQLIIVDVYENNAYDIQQELLMYYGRDLNLEVLIASVRDYNKMDEIFKKYRPEVVFHAAAHKHVPLMETSPEEAVKNNVIGTFNVATLSDCYNVKRFVMISTDKAVNPTNVMGATKRCCEMIVQYMSQEQTSTEFVTVRFGNVLGTNGSVIPLFKKQIESGKDVTVTHPDIIRYFMTIPEAVSLVLEAGAMANGGEIFVLDMGEQVKIVSLAEKLIRLYGKVPYKDVNIVFTGLRPGEKLYEELLMDEENLQSTKNSKIFIGNQIHIDVDTFINRLTKLRDAAISNDSELTVSELEKLVPTFNRMVPEQNIEI